MAVKTLHPPHHQVAVNSDHLNFTEGETAAFQKAARFLHRCTLFRIIVNSCPLYAVYYMFELGLDPVFDPLVEVAGCRVVDSCFSHNKCFWLKIRNTSSTEMQLVFIPVALRFV